MRSTPVNRRIIYVQYTNPAAYPPLEHSSRILADRGWQVTFLGVGASGQADAFRFPAHPNIQVRQWPFLLPSLRQKLQFLGFCWWVAMEARRQRALWLYASDALSCPPTLLAARLAGCRMIYHEHDSPPPSATSFQGYILRARQRLAQMAQAIVLPNAIRVEAFRRETQTMRPVFCVWNCPERREVGEIVPGRPGTTVLFYHGSLNSFRLPLSMVEALRILPEHFSLRFAGYTTTGDPDFLTNFVHAAQLAGLTGRVSYLGAPSERRQLLKYCRGSTVGATFMPVASDDVNMRTMAGASNKPFDYLACGMAVLVSDLPEWKQMFVEPGYGLACNPADCESIARALRWFGEHPEQTLEMGARGRERILGEWNYETQFAPVLAQLEAVT